MKRLYLATLGEVDAGMMAALAELVESAFDEPSAITRFPDLDFAYDAARGQYGSIPALEMLLRGMPEDALKMVGVTGRDLFIPVLTFVYGQAQLGGQAAIVSLARLRQEFYGLPANREVFLERARKETLHEAGHAFGLVHCADPGCAMSLATNIGQIDRKRAAFCAVCAAHLARRPRE